MRLYAKKIDDLEKSHQNLVSREYLDEQLDRMREDRLQMHRENRESIDNLVERMDRILERVR